MTTEFKEKYQPVQFSVGRIDYGKFWAPDGASDWETLATTDDIPPNYAKGYVRVFGLDMNDDFPASEFRKRRVPQITPDTAKDTVVPHAVAVALSRGVYVICQTRLLNESFGRTNMALDRITPQQELHVVQSTNPTLPLGSTLYSQHPSVYDIRKIPQGMKYIPLGPARQLTLGAEDPFENYMTSIENDKQNHMRLVTEKVVGLLNSGKKAFVVGKALTTYERVLIAEESMFRFSITTQKPPTEYRWATEPIYTRINFETVVFGEKEEYETFGAGMELLQI